MGKWWGANLGMSNRLELSNSSRPGESTSTDFPAPLRALRPSIVANPYDGVLPPPIIRPTLLWV